MAKITGYRVDSVTADGGSIVIKGVFLPMNEEFSMHVNDDDTLNFMKETVKREMARRNKLDDVAITLQSIVGVTVTP